MFRSRTGQTGKDAYVYEAAAIANAIRDLDKKYKEILEAAHSEHPELFKRWTDFHPELGARAQNAGKFVDYLLELGVYDRSTKR